MIFQKLFWSTAQETFCFIIIIIIIIIINI